MEQFLEVFVGCPFVFLRYTPEAPWCQIPDCHLPLIGRLTRSTAGSWPYPVTSRGVHLVKCYKKALKQNLTFNQIIL